MKRPLRQVTHSDLAHIIQAQVHLTEAKTCLIAARAPNAHKAVARAAKSVSGAYRHAERCYTTQQRRTQTNDAAYDYGKAVGCASKINNDPAPTAKGTGLRGELRRDFERGIKQARS